MPSDFLDLIATWDGLAVVVHHDQPTGSWIFICMHDVTLGPATGGTRLKSYPSHDEAVLDGMRLAAGMTAKWAAIDIDFGGGKAVLDVPQGLAGEDRDGLLRRYGELVESLRGGFLTGEDLGTSTRDMRIVAERTGSVQGFHPVLGKLDPSPYTARGVFSGIRAALGRAYGSEEVAGRRVLIEGMGNVGWRLAELLRSAGAELLVTDLDDDRVARAASELGATPVSGRDAYEAPCDVYAPCAIGATLNEESIPRLACRLVAGSANNQLAEPADAERLLERGILYAPDFIINAGGAMSFALMEGGLHDTDALMERMEAIGETLRETLGEAAERGESPTAAAGRRVERALARRRQERG
jgi:leucine dehydrogenase